MASQTSPLYEFSMVPFIRMMQNLRDIMGKAEEHAKEKQEDVENYAKLRIYHDMGDFIYQIQRLSNAAKNALSLVSSTGSSIDSSVFTMPDTETSWSEVKTRLSRTITLLEDHAKPEDFVGQENKEVSLFGGKYKMSAEKYLKSFAVPNFYFHATTAYNLLRGAGVPIGKKEYMAGDGDF